MITFEIQAPNGRTIEVQGDRQPTDEEMDEILRGAGLKAPARDQDPFMQRVAGMGLSEEQQQEVYSEFASSYEKYASQEKAGKIDRAKLNARESFFMNTLLGAAMQDEATGNYAGPAVSSTGQALSPRAPAKRPAKTEEEKLQGLKDVARRYGEYAGMPDSKGVLETMAAGLGQVAGSLPSPENVVPGMQGKGGLVSRAGRAGLAAAGVNAAVSPAVQQSAVDAGLQDEVTLRQTLTDAGLGFVAGGLLQGGGDLAVKGLERVLARLKASPEALARAKAKEAEIAAMKDPVEQDAARAEYVRWWESQLDKEDALRQSQAGRDALKADMEGRVKDQTRSMAAEIEAGLKGNQLKADDTSPIIAPERDPAVDRQMLELDLRKDVPPKEDRLLSEYEARTGRSPYAMGISPLPPIGIDPDKVLATFKSEFRARGKLEKNWFDGKTARDGSRVAEQAEIERNSKMLAKAMGKDADNPAMLAKVNQALQDGSGLGALPVEVADVVNEMRLHRKRLSTELRNAGWITGDLRTTIDNNMDVYLHRSYRAFDDPNWGEQVKMGMHVRGSIFDRAKQFLRTELEPAIVKDLQAKGVTNIAAELDKRLIGEVSAILDGAAKDMDVLAGGRGLDVVKKRGDIPVEIRELLGEYKDPFVNYTKTTGKMAQYLAESKFRYDIKQDGLGKYLFENPQGEYSVKIGGTSPIGGLYTTKNYADVLATMDDLAPVTGNLHKMFLSAGAWVQYSKAIANNITQIRNVVSGVSMVVGQGHFGLLAGKGEFQKVAKTVWSHVNKLGSKATLNNFKDYARLGLVDGDVNVSALRGILQDIQDRDYMDIPRVLEKTLLGKVKAGAEKVADVYQATDNFFRIISFEKELERYSRRLGMSPSDPALRKQVAEIVNSVYPNYSRIPKFVKRMRRVPVIGNFMAFPSETVRTAFNTVELAMKEMKDPVLRPIGVKRLASFMSVSMVGAYGASVGARMAFGVDKDEVEAAREFVPEWSRNSELLAWRNNEGKVSYVDMSYYFPYSYLSRPIRAMVAGANPEESIAVAAKEFLAPFVSERILTAKLVDVARNRTDDGRAIYNPMASTGDKAEAVFKHLGDAFMPGVINNAQKVYKSVTGQKGNYGREYDPQMEITANLTGARVQTIDPVQDIKYAAYDYGENIRLSSMLFNNQMNKQTGLTGDEIVSHYGRSNEARLKAMQELARKVFAAQQLGARRQDVIRSLREARVTQEDIKHILAGKFRPLDPSKEAMTKAFAGMPAAERLKLVQARREWSQVGLFD